GPCAFGSASVRKNGDLLAALYERPVVILPQCTVVRLSGPGTHPRRATSSGGACSPRTSVRDSTACPGGTAWASSDADHRSRATCRTVTARAVGARPVIARRRPCQEIGRAHV